ncbi:unnamed protein product [Allacma fusca]|uniref:Uncharacterized protein n=1 Tax=Allacma fusca TaxID=39272 RepID=A0A8J2LIV7_9HEXA|nr:unnamed protein product [Allacma fusca]
MERPPEFKDPPKETVKWEEGDVEYLKKGYFDDFFHAQQEHKRLALQLGKIPVRKWICYLSHVLDGVERKKLYWRKEFNNAVHNISFKKLNKRCYTENVITPDPFTDPRRDCEQDEAFIKR